MPVLLMHSKRSPSFGLAIATIAGTGLFIAGWWWIQQHQGNDFLPHGYCLTWIPSLLWLHITSDSLIALSYLTIPVTLVYFVRRRGDVPFGWMFLLFGSFIVACGSTHALEVWTLWYPDYWFAGGVKALTAGISVATAAALVVAMPKALAIPSVEALRQAKEALEQEVLARRQIEGELRQAQAELEARVSQRTAALVEANAERARLLREAQQANRQKDEFMARVSHELRTPLQAMMSWVALLESGRLDAATALHAVNRVGHNVRLQARMISDLLDVSRILSGELSVEPALTDPAEAVMRSLDALAGALREKGVALEIDVAPGMGLLVSDAQRIEQVVSNLVSNAVKYTQTGGQVRIRAAWAADDWLLTVHDDGIGIDALDLLHIFQPFRRGSQPAAAQQPGLGLGLAIAHHIVGRLGGSLAAESRGVGQGATFTLRLPRSGHGPTGAGGHAGAPAPASLGGVAVLFVEDQPDVADATARTLRLLGASVAVAHGLRDALGIVDGGGFTPGVLVSDLRLADESSGFDVLRELRARFPRLPAIALSAHGSPADLQATAAAGFSRHLVKPADAATLVAAIVATVG